MPVTLEQEVMEAILNGLSLYLSNSISRFSTLNKPSSLEGITSTSAIVSNHDVWFE